MAVGMAGALLLPVGYQVAYAVCLLMSVLYSVPPFRLKSVPGADWVINMLGFGTLTAYAGWAATGLPLTTAGLLVLLGFCPLFAALYPLTQIYQNEEDARRGDRTLTLALGIRLCLVIAIVSAAVAFALFAGAGIAAGWGFPDAARWTALGISGLAWAFVLLPWLSRHASMRPSEHQRGMYRALLAWAVTDLVVVLSWGT
jgi:4-hydroxybenzoate polyprenyltransferase